MTLNGDQATAEDSDGTCTIVVKYENASGETKKYTEKTNVYVSEEMDDADVPADDMGDTQSKKGLPLAAKIAIGVAAVVVVIVVVRVIVKKRRKKKEEELMDDELL